MTFAAFQAETTQRVWEIAAGMAVGILAVVGIVFLLLRRFFQSTQDSHQADVMMTPPRTENPSGVYDRVDAGSDPAAARSGEGTREAAQD